MSAQLIAAYLRPGHPDFLDLPWSEPLERWPECCPRVESLPHGESRHTVIFVNYEGVAYALKVLPEGRAQAEYEALRVMEERRLPAVKAVGHLRLETPGGEISVLVTQYLDHSLPYTSLFLEAGLSRYRDHLQGALAGLLVQLHVAQVYWGDCSLANTLFKRDAGRLQAYLVDAETSETLPQLTDARRQNELDVMEENVGGALLDLVSLQALPVDFPCAETAAAVRRRYEELWREVNQEELLRPGDRYRIEERVRKLNALGFSVGELEIEPSGDQLKLKVFVTDRNFHRDLLHSLTGLVAEERQAQQLMNEIQQVRVSLAEQHNRSASLSGAAYHWMERVFRPTVARLREQLGAEDFEPVERYFELLEHKWYLSERAQKDVGLGPALLDYCRSKATTTASTTPPSE